MMDLCSRFARALFTKPLVLAAMFLLLHAGATSAVTLRQESFELPPDGTNYTDFGVFGTNSTTVNQYFKRGANADFNMGFDLGNLNGSSFYGGENTAHPTQGITTGDCSVTLGILDVRGFENLQAIWAVATPRDTVGNLRFEKHDHMTLQAALDTNAWVTLGSFRGPDATDGYLRQDTNLDGVGNGTIVTRNFANFTHNIAGAGTGLLVRVLLRTDATDEEVAFDNIRITGDAITPSIAITNPPSTPIAVAESVDTYDLAGIANLGVVGTIAWTNGLTGQHGGIPAATNWSLPNLPLGIGVNLITVRGSNTVGGVASAAVSIWRVAAPVLAITNPPTDIAVSDLVAAQTLQGTANDTVHGLITWTNTAVAGGTTAAGLNWSIPNIPLALGTNIITLTATNVVQQSTSAVRQIYKVPPPAVTITTPTNGTAVAHTVPSVTVQGTANGEAFGLLRWTNALTGGAGSTAAGLNWSVNVPIINGINTIAVTSSNIVGRLATATVSVHRIAAPVLTITTPPTDIAVSDLVAAQTLQGTANDTVHGLITWTNAAVAGGTTAAGLNWSIPNIPLALGTNIITLTATNVVQQSTSAVRQIYKVPPPAVTITTPANGTAVAHTVPSVTVQGTANGEAFGLLRWTNALTGGNGSTAAGANWSVNVPLTLGTNAIQVSASNIVGRMATTTVSVYQVAAPVLAITAPAPNTTLPHAQTTTPVSGTANGVVEGLLAWTNLWNGAAGTAPAGMNWSIPSVALTPGINTIAVVGTNAAGAGTMAFVMVGREGAILLNEIVANPVGDDAASHAEFVEALRPAGPASAAGLTLLVVDGNGADAGLVVERWDWNGLAFGANGLLLTGHQHASIPYGSVWSNQVSPHTGFGSPSGMGAGDIPNTSVTFLLVQDCQPGVVVGFDLDGNNDGQLDTPHPWSALLDSVGWTDWSVGDHVYSPAALTQSSGTPDAATRLQTNRVPHDASAWYNGDLMTGLLDSVGRYYNPTQASANLPAGATLTPGRFNYPFPYDEDADGLPDWWEQLYFGSPTGASPHVDSDFDGYTNLEEFWAGTHPQDPHSRFEIGGVVSTGLVTAIIVTNQFNEVVTQGLIEVRSLLLSWDSASNRLYAIRGTTNLHSPYMTLTGGLAATPPMNVQTINVQTLPQHFYRIEVGEPIFPW